MEEVDRMLSVWLEVGIDRGTRNECSPTRDVLGSPHDDTIDGEATPVCTSRFQHEIDRLGLSYAREEGRGGWKVGLLSLFDQSVGVLERTVSTDVVDEVAVVLLEREVQRASFPQRLGSRRLHVGKELLEAVLDGVGDEADLDVAFPGCELEYASLVEEVAVGEESRNVELVMAGRLSGELLGEGVELSDSGG